MKVLFLTTSFPRRSGDYAGLFVFHLARHLRAQGVEIDVLTPGDRRTPEFETREGIRIHRFRFFLNGRLRPAAGGGGIPERLRRDKLLAAWMPAFLFSFLRAALRCAGEADIVHCQWFPLGWLGLALRILRGKKFVVNVRGSDKVFLRGAFRVMANPILWTCSAAVAVSRDLLGRLPGSEKTHYIPNGVDVALRKEFPLDTREKIILYAGNLSGNKSVRTLLEAVPHLKHAAASRFLIVGDGGEKPNLVRLARDLGIEDRVRFAPALVQEEIFYLMGRSFLFVLPSLSEGRSNVLLEALASGLPVVASRIPANREIIEEGKNGLLFEPGNAIELAENIDRLLENPDLRNRLAEEGPRFIQKQGLTWENASHQYMDLYRKIVAPEVS